MKLADLIEEFNVVIDTADGLNELRSLILGLAVRGKLVPQDINDEPATELLKKIEAEKERLYEEGGISKPKEYPTIHKDEYPFEIPDNWVWARNGNLILFQNGYAFKSGRFQDSGIGVIRIGDLQNGQVVENSMKFISEDYASEVKDDYLIGQGDMLIAMSGATTGKIAINTSNNTYLLNQRVGKIDPIKVNQNYLYRYLNTKIEENLAKSSGSAIPNLSTKQIGELEIPLPPLAEQHRIVQKIETLFAEVDELEAKLHQQVRLDKKLQKAVNAEVQRAPDAEASKSAWNFITSNFDTLYHTPDAIDNLKKNILNEAVRGRLVPQNPNDEPASELLKKIEAEKQRLYDAGEIRKPKDLPPVEEDEIPFEIPESWEWCRLGALGYFTGGGTPSKNKTEYWDGDIPWVSPKDMKDDFITGAEMSITELGVENSSAKLIPEKSILIVARSGILKRTLPVGINTVTCSVNQDIKVIVPYQKSISRYLSVMLKGFEPHILTNLVKQGMTVQSLKYSEFENEPFPIPPLEEQHRIVRRIEELFVICDRFKVQLEQREAVNEQLVKGLVKEVLEGANE